ncbi:hypothetical protein ACFQ36_10935 [Arthrobacter sp. GCM10027362]|uniref:hypothetical protein n=1 Tax=Arthrobacter sp. GCM10027362 TaxID=3273379 RepID=UPI00363F2F6C
MSANAAGAGSPGYRREGTTVRKRRRPVGLKLGSAFFGWVTATGISVLLAALVATLGTAFGVAEDIDPARLAEQAAQDLRTVSITGAVVLAVVLFLAYFSGGYVAGRMARYDGAKQGVGVWLWAAFMAAVITGLGAFAGAQFDVLARLNNFPGVPIHEGRLTTGGLVTEIIAAVVALAAAVLGGKAGMHFHRKIDRTEADTGRQP